MKLTTEQIREIIRQELAEVYKGKDRVWIAPHTKSRRPHARSFGREVGAYALPTENPYDELDPDVREKIAMDSDEENLRQAYELSSMLGSEPDMDVDDFIEAVKLSNNPDLVGQRAMEALKDKITKERLRVKALPIGSEERKEGRYSINRMMMRISGLKKYLSRLKNTREIKE